MCDVARLSSTSLRVASVMGPLLKVHAECNDILVHERFSSTEVDFRSLGIVMACGRIRGNGLMARKSTRVVPRMGEQPVVS
ncbi:MULTISPECIES: hypothetical protein [Paenibacillus]|uniref:hypothetical protein n=1 Tax=Paenibacillus TaxID=44249 RepID=UPI001F35C57C|nr:hypothetical protein [Paenibacillus sp. JJ-223]